MLLNRGNGVLLAILLPMIWIWVMGLTECREIRPSGHGLTYQTTPTETETPEMKSFFGSSYSDDVVEKPEARNATDPWWRVAGVGAPMRLRAEGKSHEHMRNALLIASVVCAVLGVSLLTAAAFLYFTQFRGRPSMSNKQ
ncbi:PREDICTED: uncharacterized protein LOC104589173 [Nelumbo nucifera]|uniref:Uncharacterized protein LOC104589173 n=2 Tax=Nelumbo nucifera TaxID=4432 RepID=A0A1U7YYK4_NELNU|nr:PREDICTED: uncharacterized protein LOC104589173 [Nelumbo nucifera]DAD37200.1 TPA_asm: hypothetical protein HUJ06_007841 [Nelumbo nucifera]